MFKKILENLYKIVIFGSLIAITYCSSLLILNLYITYETIQNQEEQLEELYNQQAYVLQLIEQYQKFNTYLIGKISGKQNILHKKPSYKYLSSVTVYIINQVTGSKTGSLGTGIIVNEKNGYYYIMTNKHICDLDDVGNCYIISNNKRIKLDFIKRTESKYDLSLWRTKSDIPNKKIVNGFAIAKPQNKIYSVGQYLGNQYIYTEGTFGGLQNDYAIFNMSCAPGCSGSGVFDKNGNLIGVISALNIINISQIDTAKVLGINGDVIQLFLKDIIDE